MNILPGNTARRRTLGTVLALLAGAAARAAPLHDAFVAAQEWGAVEQVVDYEPTFWYSSYETGEPHRVASAGSVWAVWQAPADGFAVLQLHDFTNSAGVGLYTGTAVAALTELGWRTSTGVVPTEALTVPVTAGQRYRIGFAAQSVSWPNGSFRLFWTPPDPATANGRPANDAFAAAQDAGGARSFMLTGSTLLATLEPGEPREADGQRSVWYRWQAPADGYLTWGSSGTEQLGIYEGAALGALVPVPSWSAGQSPVRVRAGQEYRLAVREQLLARSYAVGLALGGSPPAYDDFAGAAVLPPAGSLTVELRNCEREAGEPAAPGNAFLTAWARWVVPASGSWRLLAESTDFLNKERQTVLPALDVFTGTSLAALTRVAAYGSTEGTEAGGVYTLSAGAEVRVRLRGGAQELRVSPETELYTPADRAGRVTLRLERLAPATAQDAFAAAAVLPEGGVAGNLGLATAEPGEVLAVGESSVWYRWVPAESGQYDLISTCDDRAPPAITLWRGAGGLAGLTRVPALENLPVEWPGVTRREALTRATVTAGLPLWLQVHGQEHTTDWPFTLRILATPWPQRTEALMAGAVRLTGTAPLEVSAPLTGALDAGTGGLPRVYYSWQPPAGTWEVRLAGVSLETHALELLDIAGYPASAQIAEGWSWAPATRRIVTTTGSPADRLFFAITARRTEAAWEPLLPVTLRITPVPRPPHDDWSAAADAGSAQQFSLPLALNGATAEPLELSLGNWYSPVLRSQWVRWTAPATGEWDVRVTDRPAVVVEVFTGSTLAALERLPGAYYGEPQRYSLSAGKTYYLRAATDRIVDGGTLTLRPAPARPRPENDHLADATVLPAQWSVDIQRPPLRATIEEFEGGNSSYYGSVWYRWTAPGDGVLLAAVSLGTVTLYLNGTPPLTAVPGSEIKSEDYYTGFNSCSSVRVAAGQTYLIRVETWEYPTPWSFSLRRQELPAPAHDERAAAEVLPPLPPGVAPTVRTASLRGSTRNYAADPYSNSGGGDVWYRWRAPQSGTFWFSVSHPVAEVDLVLNSYGLHAARCYEHNGTEELAVLKWSGETTLTVTAGKEYDLRVEGPNAGNATDFILRCALLPPAVHDTPASAVTVPTGTWTPLLSLAGATPAPGDGRYDGISPTVWYAWTAPATGAWQLSLRSAPVNQADAGIYSGSAGQLTEHLFNPAGGGYDKDWLDPVEEHLNGTTHTTFRASAGIRYLIMLRKSQWYDPLPLACRVRIQPATRPANDDMAQATDLGTAAEVSVTGTLRGATGEPGEPDYSGNSAAHGVWYRWTAPSAGEWAAGVPNSFNVECFTGSGPRLFQPVLTDSGHRTLAAGQSIWIRVSLGYGDQERYRLEIHRVAAPPRIVSAQLSPASVDLRQGPAVVRLLMELETPSGLAEANLSLQSHTGYQACSGLAYRSAGQAASLRLSGDDRRGTYLFTIPISSTSPTDVYYPRLSLLLPDYSGLLPESAWAGGAPPALAVTAGTVVVPPPVVSLSFTPAALTPGYTGPLLIRATISSPQKAFHSGTILHSNDDYDTTRREVEFTGAQRVSGTPWEGTYEIPFSFPPEGAGPVNYFSVLARVTGEEGQTVFSGWETLPLPVMAGADFSGPLTLIPWQPLPEVDVTAGPAPVTWTVRVLDAESGVRRGQINLYRPNGAGLLLSQAFTRISGTAADGIHEAAVTIPAGTPAGEYRAEIRFADTAGNWGSSDTYHTFGGRSLPLLVVNRSSTDNTAPVLTSLHFHPTTLTLPGTVRATLLATDDYSGITTGVITLTDRLGTPLARATFTVAHLTAGDARNGTWEISFPVPANPDAVSGPTTARVELTDAFGKSSLQDLPAGIPHTLPVLANPSAHPYQQWLAAQPGLTLATSPPLADADGDGIPNLLQMALAPGTLHAAWTPDGLELRGSLSDFLRREPGTVRLTAETSPDLLAWPGNLPVTPDAAGEFRVLIPSVPPQHPWVRLRATLLK